jgi:di/tricarboxylate transporter
VLLVKGWRDQILRVEDIVGIDIRADARPSAPGLQTEQVSLVEGILMPRSPLIGRTLKGVRLRQRYGLQLLGLNRHGKALLTRISQVRLRAGDRLLVQGHWANIAVLDEDNTLRIPGAVDAILLVPLV